MKLKKILLITALFAMIFTFNNVNSYANKIISDKVSKDNIEKKVYDLYELQFSIDKLAEKSKYTNYQKVAYNLSDTTQALRSMFENINLNPYNTSYNYENLVKRVELMQELYKTLEFGINDLTDKPYEINKKVIDTINDSYQSIMSPATSNTMIQFRIKNLIEIRKINLPDDINKDDIADFHYKRKLARVIWDVRFKRDSVLFRNIPKRILRNLNKNLTHAVGIQLNTKTTYKEVDSEIENLQKLLKEAMDQRYFKDR